MTADLIFGLRKLWKQAFGDSDGFLDGFFATGFSDERCNFLLEDGQPVSALYWFDCQLKGQKLAYVYAVATDAQHRGKGLAHKLMHDTHARLREQGYVGVILVPGSKSLFDFYGKMGYHPATTVTEFSCEASNAPISLTKIDARQYADLRRAYLPRGGVVQEGVALDFFATYGKFYKGEDFLLACAEQDGILQARELLGNANLCGNILCTLGLSQGVFRTPGMGRNFAMYFPLQEGYPAPSYFGFALD